MDDLLLGVVLVIAILDWVAVARNWKKAEYVLKPATMILLLGWFLTAAGLKINSIWFVIGLVLSLAGDIFLQLPKEQFIAGLTSFLIAQIAYTAGFLMGIQASLRSILLPAIFLAFLVFLTVFQIYKRLEAGLISMGTQKMRIPVLAYSIVISLMLFSALLTLVRPDWEQLPATIVSAGALLFFFSDTLLGWNRFVKPLPYQKIITIITYHLGQILIAFGVVMRLTG